MSSTTSLRLSVCISTLNRANLIGATLESILAQLTEECELVVLDAASTDNTGSVVLELARRFRGLRYIRQDVNNGFDRDFDRAVELARGEYCWLMSDDDLLVPGAIDAVLGATRRGYSLVVVNAESRDVEMARVLHPSALDNTTDVVIQGNDMDGLFLSSWKVMTYIGCVVVRRELWLSRERDPYYGSWLIHVGVLFQKPLPSNALVMAQPLVSIRIGNQSWHGRRLEIAMTAVPTLFKSLPLSYDVRRRATYTEPWRSFHLMLFYRAVASLSLSDCRSRIWPQVHSLRRMLIPILAAAVPGVVANSYLVFVYSARPHADIGGLMISLKQSPHYIWGWPSLFVKRIRTMLTRLKLEIRGKRAV